MIPYGHILIIIIINIIIIIIIIITDLLKARFAAGLLNHCC